MLKRITPSEMKYVGDIPKAGTVIDNPTKTFNVFNYHYGYQEAKTWWIEYLHSVKDKNANACKIVPDSKLNTTLGWISKLKLLKCTIPESVETWFIRENENAIKMALSYSKPEEKRERIKSEHVPILARIEDELDIFYKNNYSSTVKFKELYAEYNASTNQLKSIVEVYSRLLAEINSITKEKDLKEAYSHLSKNQVKAYCEFVRGVVEDASAGLENQKRLRKPRTKKKISNAKIVQGLKYLAHSKELNINSVNPEKLVGCSTAWFFNQKTRQLFYLTAKAGEKLGVKGTTITGFDPSKSQAKKVRKPEQDVPPIATAAKRASYQLFASLTTKPQNQDIGRISADCLILKIEP